ncbi:DNA internalization-related competence protein ComEC/Rec2 [Lentibacillus halophilus]|uniref:DNA internalization-related competence protein ComEC/Rec2 n=1 Tax=Lentibacillus halophilus TaxID=295065 RepID=A0ABN0ZCJ3_9BACI
MRGYWYIPALGIISSLLSILFQHVWIIGIFTLWIIWLYARKKLGKWLLIISLAASLLAFFYLPDLNDPPPDLPYSQQQPITGQITSPVNKTETTVDFTLTDNGTGKDFLITYFGDELVDESVKFGASCTIEGTPELPETGRNPGQFDYRNYLASQGVYYQVMLDSPDAVTCSGGSIIEPIYQLRSDLTEYIHQKVSPKTAIWLNALVLGDDSGISDETKERFQRWNLTHLLAISGLHVGLIVGFLYLLLVTYAGMTKEKAQWTVMMFLPIYAFLAGGEPSVWRASTMVLLFILARKLHWRSSTLDVLSIVFIALICLDKYIVYQIGFQLSFCVTFGLLLSKDWIAATTNSFFSILKISFISQMMILPLQAAYFFTFQPLSILVNTVIVPYFTLFVIPLMFAVLLLAPVAGFLLPLLDGLFVQIHDWFLLFMQLVDQVAYKPLIIGSIPLAGTVLYYIIFVSFMMKAEAARHKAAFAWGCSLTLLLIIIVSKPYVSPDGKVTMLDIGQGDAIVVELPYRKSVVLIDAGATTDYDTGEPSENVYKQRIKPYLLSQGIGKLDAIFVSHGDMDHVGSLPYITADFPVQYIITSHYDSLDDSVHETVRGTETDIVRVESGDVLTISGHEFKVLSPDEDNGSPNENSLVLYSELGGKTWLFTGDIGTETESGIIRDYPGLQSDVLKVAHHGSGTSTDSAFLKEIQPAYGLLSVGENNMYGHPDADVIRLLKKENVQKLRTDEDGAIQYHFRGKEGTFSTFLP